RRPVHHCDWVGRDDIRTTGIEEHGDRGTKCSQYRRYCKDDRTVTLRLMHRISDKPLSLEDLRAILDSDTAISLSDEARIRIIRCREYLDNKVRNTRDPVYGINTGFGSLYNRNIADD